MARKKFNSGKSLDDLGKLILELAAGTPPKLVVTADRSPHKTSTGVASILALAPTDEVFVHYDGPLPDDSSKTALHIVVPYYPDGPPLPSDKSAAELLGLVTIMGCAD